MPTPSSKASKAKASSATPPTAKTKKFSFKKLPRADSDGGSSWKAGRRRANKKSKAVFSLVAAKYQKGDKEGQYSGAIYFRGVPCYGQNEEFKTKLQKYTLAECLRFNMEMKLYTCKVYTKKQARKLLGAMKELDGCADSLPEDIDESVFEHAKPAEVSLVSNMTVNDETVVGVTGTTYPFKDELKDKGFTFNNEVNGEEGVQMWLAPQDDVEIDELVSLFEDYGFTVEVFDGVEVEEGSEGVWRLFVSLEL